MLASKDFTIEELLIAAMAREIKDGDFIMHGFGIWTPYAAFALAKKTHAPHSLLFCCNGFCVTKEPPPMSLIMYEKFAIENAMQVVGADFMNWIMGPRIFSQANYIEFFTPAQIDPFGNFNVHLIGSYEKPKVRLPGGGGISEVLQIYNRLFYYVPVHEKRVFVPKLDFISGVGYLNGNLEERRRAGITGGGPYKVFTNLCVLGFDESTNRMKIISVHPGVTVDQVKENTGFELLVPHSVPQTTPPSEEDVKLIRNEIDPFELRRLESLSGANRMSLIEQAYFKELGKT